MAVLPPPNAPFCLCAALRALAQYTVQSWETRSLHSMSKATNPEGKLCFLKRFHAVAGDDQTKLKAHKQFQASMAAVRALTHDSILRPTGYFVENNDYILEMPYCAGGTLTQWLERGTRSVTERHGVAVRLVAALRFMHSKGEMSRFVVLFD
jgi:serine/threonine protein kinase